MLPDCSVSQLCDHGSDYSALRAAVSICQVGLVTVPLHTGLPGEFHDLIHAWCSEQGKALCKHLTNISRTLSSRSSEPSAPGPVR